MHLVTALVMVVALAGCAGTGGSGPGMTWPPVVRPAQSDIERLLAYHVSLLALKPAELAIEYDRVRNAFAGQPGNVRRIQLAMLLSRPGAPFRDDSAALALLQEVMRDNSGSTPALQALASLMHTHVAEQKRAEEALQAQTAKLRDEQRRAEALQQKLEALLEMEMRMIEREQSIQPRKR